MALTGTSFTWAGITIDEEGPYYLQSVEGWSGPSDGSADDVAVGGGHGSLLTRVTRKARVVSIDGTCVSEADRDSLFCALDDALAAGFGDGDGAPDLVGSVAGRTLSSGAQLMRYAPLTVQGSWVRGVFAWSLQFRCPDPLRYGPQSSTVVPITVPTLGITFPISGDWVFPVDPVGGPASVLNPGNAATDAAFTLTGALSSPGVVVLETGKKVVFDFDLAATDTLMIDTAQGLCTLNGEYRSPTVVSALLDEMRLPAAGVATVQPLGTPLSGSPSLSVTYRPAYW